MEMIDIIRGVSHSGVGWHLALEPASKIAQALHNAGYKNVEEKQNKS